ncbi:MAG: endolytic transglycosylase MltG [Candidatus Eremiobacteraeota bacterium]|nr:endolytic transglycosylase MltG [Candidatus Eremiobacteraeota bacterium]
MTRTVRVAGGITVAVALVVVAIAAWFFYSLYGDRSHPVRSTQVIVPRGSTLGDVADQLTGAGVISNTASFRLLARMQHADADVHAGEFQFAPHQTPAEVLHALVTGGAQIATWVTIPEGFTASQIAERLQSAGVSSGTNFGRYFLSTPFDVDGTKTQNLEGFLFPSTYLVPLDATGPQIEKQFTDEFSKQLPSDASTRARALHVTVPQGVTVASLVEREAKIDSDRPIIAGVIYNRLRLNMPLQVDATIEYALPQHKTELSFGDLKIQSPYNSYLHAGLPPTPIANPGHASLEAAFHPAPTDALYYVYCGNGHHVFAKTLAEHQANVARCLH